MKHTNYCSRCKATDVPLLKYSKGRNGMTQYYQCRDCQSEKQRAYRKTSSGSVAVKRSLYNQYKKNRKKIIARNMVNHNVRVGKLIKPEHCSRCGDTRNIQGHHPDYNKPLEVLWLCSSCHSDEHRV